MRLTKLLVGAALGLGLGACGGGADRADVASVGATTSTRARQRASAPLPPSTTFAPDRPPCSPSRLSVEVTTDKATYRPGETVKVLATLRNISGAPCFYTNYVGEQRFETAAGSPIRPGSMFIADALKNSSLAPGATLTQSPT